MNLGSLEMITEAGMAENSEYGSDGKQDAGMKRDDQVQVIRELSKALIDQNWPEQSALFEKYWPFFEEAWEPQSSYQRRQGAAELWVYEPYVVGILSGIVGQLIINAWPDIVSSLSEGPKGLLRALQGYYRKKPSAENELMRDAKAQHGSRPDVEKIVRALNRLVKHADGVHDGNEEPKSDR